MHIANTRRSLTGSNEGASTLEMALLLPVLLVVVFGLVEFGYNLFARTTVEKAAQLGARSAVTGEGFAEGTRLALVRSKARQLTEALTGGDPNSTAITVQVRSYPGGNTSGAAVKNDAGAPCDVVEVQVDYRYAPLTPIVGALLPAEIGVTGKERMINEPWAACK